jgi:GNAT superfamily N-acetyltransferase
MLVKLYALPDHRVECERLASEGVVCRRAESYERSAVLQFVKARWPQWPDEALAAFAHMPPTIFVAAERTTIVAFACYNATRPNYFGPTGVDPQYERRGLGRVLLLQCLDALAHEGYGYAIIGGVGPAEFYERACGATLIPDSEPGIYRSFARVQPD